jgi:hypothetical protein
MMCAGFRASTGVKYRLETKEGVELDVVFDTRKEVEKWAINALGTYPYEDWHDAWNVIEVDLAPLSKRKMQWVKKK